MQVDANSKRVRKYWSVGHSPVATYLSLAIQDGSRYWWAVEDVTGASPAYVEVVVEELNIRVNEMLYNLGRIQHGRS